MAVSLKVDRRLIAHSMLFLKGPCRLSQRKEGGTEYLTSNKDRLHIAAKGI